MSFSGTHTAFRNSAGKPILVLLFCVLCVLLLASLFGNISRPLFWADESMTVMHGERVLAFGYPKVHDGKNVVYDLRHPNPVLGIDEKTDAFIGGANWGQYYYAAVGIKLAELSSDLYTKTGIIRSTFALAGLAGLGLLAAAGIGVFRTGASRLGFLVLFILLELISVPLALHLREARYYSLALLLTALVVLIYTRHRFLGRMKRVTYGIMLIGALFLLYCVFSPAWFILAAALALHELILFIRVRRRPAGTDGIEGNARPAAGKDLLLRLLPLVLSAATVAPLHVFFRTSAIAGELLRFNTLSTDTDALHLYLANLSFIGDYFTGADLLVVAVVLKIVLFFLQVRSRGADHNSQEELKTGLSNFLTLAFVLYVCFIAKIPNPLFTRYLIPLQPVLSLIIVLDLATAYNLVPAARSRTGKAAILLLFAAAVLYNVAANWIHLKGHAYELTHEYRGPLDYVIPFIHDRYPDTGSLAIATNYEETSFMYYLHAKVVVGFVGNNLEEDAAAVPDIIVYRKGWGNFGGVFNGYLDRARYARITFPVADSPMNNLPELNWRPPFMHRFRTETTADESEKTDIFVRR